MQPRNLAFDAVAAQVRQLAVEIMPAGLRRKGRLIVQVVIDKAVCHLEPLLAGGRRPFRRGGRRRLAAGRHDQQQHGRQRGT
jgi:hypothetical protein